MSKIKNGVKWINILCILMLMHSCDEGVDTVIPDVPVRILVEMYSYPYSLVGNGGSIMYGFPAGYAGVIIYKEAPGVYYAYDACCPNHVEERTQVVLDGALAICPIDSSEFILADGFLGLVVKGPSKYGLKQYRTSVSTSSRGDLLNIYN